MSSYLTYTQQTSATGKEIENPFSNLPQGSPSDNGLVGKLNLIGQSIAKNNESMLETMLSNVNAIPEQRLSPEEVKRRMEQIGNSLKEDITSNINIVTSQATQYINGLSGRQQIEAISAWGGIIGRISSAFVKAMAYIKEAIQAVLGWAQDMWAKVKSLLTLAKQAFMNIFS